MNDLMEALREKGQMNPADISAAVLEPSGKMSVFPNELKRSVQPSDLNITPPKESLPNVLITDGRVHDRVLRNCGVSGKWLSGQLSAGGFSNPREVLIAILDSQGKLYLQGKESMERCVQFDTGVKGS